MFDYAGIPLYIGVYIMYYLMTYEQQKYPSHHQDGDYSINGIPVYIGMLLVYSCTTVMHMLFPLPKIVEGYACDQKGRPLEYHLTGLNVFLLMTSLFFRFSALVPMTGFYSHYWTNLMHANVIGLTLSFYYLWKGGTEPYVRCITKDQLSKVKSLVRAPTTSPPSLLRFFLGCEWNPRFDVPCVHVIDGKLEWPALKIFDVKMWLYLVGAVGLQFNLCSFFLTQRLNHGNNSWAMYTYMFCFEWFLCEYMLFEEVHLYTYDIFAEKIGFKLVWGCLVFYPFFYCIGGFPLVTAQHDMNVGQCVFTVVLFLIGWCLTRGANMQKFYARTQPNEKHVLWGWIKQETIPDTRILCSGFWGMSRHVNYMGEIVQALALSIPGVLVGEGMIRYVPLLYPLYYLLLFVPRQFDDDVVCSMKYGDRWVEYKKRVPYRIIPGIW